MEKVQIIPPPKEVDRRVLAWKGAAVLGKMDGISDLWVTQSDWVSNISSVLPNVSFSPTGYSWDAWAQRAMLLLVINIRFGSVPHADRPGRKEKAVRNSGTEQSCVISRSSECRLNVCC
jgi:hypothetical protein